MKKKQFTLLAICLLGVLLVTAQNPNLSWSTIDNEVSNATVSLKQIIRYIATILISAGFIYVLSIVITGKSDAKEKIGWFLAGLAIYIIALTLNWI